MFLVCFATCMGFLQFAGTEVTDVWDFASGKVENADMGILLHIGGCITFREQ